MRRIISGWVVLFLLCCGLAEARVCSRVVDIKYYKTYDWVKIVVKLSRFVKPQISYWTEENKIIVDFPHVAVGRVLHLPIRYGNVLAIRTGQFSSRPLVARIVIDLFSPGKYRFRYAPAEKKVVIYVLSPSKKVGEYVNVSKKVVKEQKKIVKVNQKKPFVSKYSGISYWANKRITVDFRSADIRDVFRAIARMVGMNILIDSSVSGTITVSFKDIPFSKAFDWLLRMGHVSYRNLGGTIIIGSEKALTSTFDKKKTIVIPVHNAQPESVAKLVERRFSTPKIIVDKRLRELIIEDSIGQLEKIKEFVREVDKENIQIMVEARVVEISLENEKELGINISEAYKKWSMSFQEGNTQIVFTNSGMEPKQFTAALNMLCREGKAHMLANPKIATLNGRKATIDLTTEIPYISSYSDNNPVFSTVTAGPKLEITPWVGDDDKITMDIDVDASTLLDWKKVGNTTVPVKGKRRAKTMLRVRNNQPIVIGGLIREQDIENLTKVPILGDIPILGALFKNRGHTKMRTEVIIIITPHIIME